MKAFNTAPKAALPPLWTASFVFICLSSLATFLAFHSLVPTLPIYIQEYGGTKGAAGLALGSLTAAAMLIRPLTGWALDTYGRRLIYLGGLLLFLLTTMIYAWTIPITALIIVRFVQGFGWGICNTASPTIASDTAPAKRMGEAMGFYSLTMSISMAIAPGISLWVMERFSFPVLFIYCSALMFIALLFALPIKYSRPEKQDTRIKFVFMEKSLLPPAIVILFVTITYGGVLNFLALFASERGLTTAGVFFMALALTTLFTRPLSGLLIDRRGPRGYDLTVIISTIASFSAMITLAQTTTTMHLAAGGILYGIGFGFMQPTMLAYCINKLPPTKRGGANATFWTAFDVGVAIGSILWGLVADTFGYGAMFNLNIIPVILAALIYFFFAKTSISTSPSLNA